MKLKRTVRSAPVPSNNTTIHGIVSEPTGIPADHMKYVSALTMRSKVSIGRIYPPPGLGATPRVGGRARGLAGEFLGSKEITGMMRLVIRLERIALPLIGSFPIHEREQDTVRHTEDLLRIAFELPKVLDVENDEVSHLTWL